MSRGPDASTVLLTHLRAAGLPAPEAEYRFHPVRRWRFDFAWPAARVALEIDGGAFSGGRHTSGAGFRADCEKGNEALCAGWRVLHVLPEHVTSGQALTWLLRALGPGATLPQVTHEEGTTP